ncbi:PAS domain S-box protein [Synechococcales cyanobacterium C]|uniref:histidine kinase n=1 Tax=Petrachloros mirabilis ULC683 TaxID=2781853 RepID=A0A8K2A8V3_9CYAN|nr:PAS domain S-box protein [Petrachloros mirabilis]NCJ07480.1 PAS domain S-box protein [Petrachloros mirabilis ULC683]
MDALHQAQAQIQQLCQELEQLRSTLPPSSGLDIFPDMTWRADPWGHLIALNARWQDYTGQSPQVALGWNFLKFVHPEDCDRIQAHWHQSHSDPHPFELTLRLLGADGLYQTFLARAYPHFDAAGQIQGWGGTYINIESILEMNAVLQNRQQFIHALLDNLAEGIVACDANGVLRLFNRATREFHNLPEAAIPAEKWPNYYSLYHTDGQTPLRPEEVPLYRALQGESVQGVEMMILPKQGQPRTVLVSGDPIIGAEGRKLGAVVAMRDITERKEIERSLQASERKFRALFNQTFQFIGLLQTDGVILEANQSALDFGGIPLDEVVGKPIWDTYWWQISPDTQTRVRHAVEQAAANEFIRYEVTVRGAGDTHAVIDFSLKPICDESGAVVLLIAEGRDITQRRQAEIQLRESEERWQLALQGTGDGIFDWTVTTGDLFMSTRMKAMLGYADAELSNTLESWRQLVHAEDIEATMQQVQRHLEHRCDQYVAEYRMHCKNGHYKWFLARGQAQWDQSGQPIRMVGSLQDISERKWAELQIAQLNEELEQRVRHRTAQLEAVNRRQDELLAREQEARRQAELYLNVAQNIPVGFLVWQLEDSQDFGSLRLVAANPATSQLLGIDLQAELGRRIDQVFPGIINSELLTSYIEVILTQEGRNLEEVQYRDERVKPSIFAVKAFPLPEQCLGLAFEDITERKQTAEALVHSEQRYRTVVNSVQEVIFQTDRQGNWVFLTPAWTAITGREIAESLHTCFTELIYDEADQAHGLDLFRSLIEGWRDAYFHEFRSLTQSGRFRWLEINVRCYRDEADQIAGTLGTLNDITERKQTEAVLQARADELTQLNAVLLHTTAQLEKRNQELDQFAYVTSHDLKAPLRAIANLSEWIEEDLQAQLTDETRVQMNLLRGRVQRMENLINGLLEYSRAGRQTVEIEVIEVGQLLAEILDFLGVPPQFSIQIAPMPTLRSERLPLQQVFANLISNAIKHHDREDGCIEIGAQDQGHFVEFRVRDDGQGIAPEYHERIFGIFQTLEARDRSENTGIGLSIVKKLIEARKGKILLESQVGQGATFRFTWPKDS